MTAIGKLMAFLLLAVGLALMTWAVGLYVQRPSWFDPIPEGGVDKGSNPVTFAQLKAETEALNRAAMVASDTWGANLKELEDREKFRNDRLNAYAERNRWARKGNPKDLADPANPKSGKGFYAPFIDSKLNLHDLSRDATGKPKGEAIQGSDGQPLPGIEGLLSSVAGDLKDSEALEAQITLQRQKSKDLGVEVVATQDQLNRMNVIRDSVRSELFFLDRFKGNVSETGETVFRRQKQLLNRLKILGISDP